MPPRTLSILILAFAHAGMAHNAQAQIAAVGVPSPFHFDPLQREFVGSLASVNILSGDPLVIPEEAIRQGSQGKSVHFEIESNRGFSPPSFPPPGIFGLRVRAKDGTIPSDEQGLPLELESSMGIDYWGWGIPVTSIPGEDFQMELLGQSGAVVARLNITPPSICGGSCKTGGCSSKAGLRSVHFNIPVGLTDPAPGLEPQRVNLEFHQEEIPIAGMQSIRLLAPESASVVPAYGSSGELQSLRVGQQLTTIQQIAGPDPEDPPGLDITISSDWQNPSTTIIRTVTIRNKMDTNDEMYLEFHELVGSHHSITAYRKTASGDWIMETGNGLRRETRSVSETVTDRTVRVKIEERTAVATGTIPAVYAVVSDQQTVSHRFSWGWQEVGVITDPDGIAQATSTFYYEQGEDSSPDGSNSSKGYLQIKQVNHPNGEIEKHYYFNNAPGDFFQETHVVKRSFAGTQDAREITTEAFSGISSTTGKAISVSRTTERVGGNIVSKRETSTEAKANGVFTEDRVFSGAFAYTSTFTFRGDDDSVTTVNPDGTASISSRTTDAQTGFTTSTQISGYVTAGGTTSTPQVRTVNLTETLTDKYGEEVTNSIYRYKNGQQVLVSRKLATTFDASHRATRFEHFVEGSDDPVFVTEREYGCCGIIRERDEAGIDTYYAHDALQRTIMTNRNGITTETVRTGLNTSMHRYAQAVPSGGSLTLLGSAAAANEISRSVSNLLGDTIEEWNRSPQDGTLVKTTIQTSYNVGGGIGRRVITLPPVVTDDAAATPSQTDDFFLDGNPAASTGNLSPNRGYRYSSTATGLTVENFLLDGASEKENTVNQSDWALRETRVTYSSDLDGADGNDHAVSHYNAKGQLSKSVDPDGVTLLYGYNFLGEQIYTALDLNGNGVIDLAVDRVSFSETDLATRQGHEWVMRTTQKNWLDTGSDAGTTTSYADVSLDGLQSWSIQNPTVQTGETKSVATLGTAGTRTQVLTRPDGTTQTTVVVNGLVTNVTERDVDNTLLYQIGNGYDSLNRTHTRTDSRSGTTTQYYVNAATDVVNRTVDNLNRETLITADHRGRQKTINLPDTVDEDSHPVANVSVTHHYPDSTIREQTGDGNYRTIWIYDYAGRATTMTTFGTAIAVTRWMYDSSRGFLTGKLYNSPTPGSGMGPSYTYTPSGRLKTRTQARLVNGNPLITNYSYGTATGSSAADLDQVSHSDSTPGYSITVRDRLGRPKELVEPVVGTRTVNYARHGAVGEESITSGILAGQKLEYGFDSMLRPRNHTATFGSQPLGETLYQYGPSGAIRSVSGSGNTAAYSYHPQKRVLERVTYTKDGEISHWLESTRKHDSANRLTRITTHVNDAGVQKAVDHHAYAYDDLDRIGSHADMTGAAWTYGYNATGEVGKAVKKMSDGTTNVIGRDYRYHFDGIGNRTQVEQSRDSGQTARTFGYTPDALNQYSTMTHPSFVDVAGSAAPATTVTVNSQSVTRQGGYFLKELAKDNSISPQWIDASITDGMTTADGSLPLPAASTTPTYDDDGNLTFDGLWNYTWDAENRLIGCERAAALVTAGGPYLRKEHEYDFIGRRIRTSIFTTSGATTPASRTLFVFDGWKCVAELDALSGNQAIRKYTWGLDLAGDIGDSSTGNVGALLWLVDSASNNTHLHLYDKNGNVSGLVDASTRKRSASYEYDAFGQLTLCYGNYAKKNPFTFSTKFTDFTTGLCYYGYRWYSPMHGRWLSRDPLGENGGLNLYALGENDAIGKIDYLGFLAVTVRVNRYAMTRSSIYSIVTISSDDPNVNKCCCLPRNFHGTEAGFDHSANPLGPGTNKNNSTFPRENGNWSTGIGLTSIIGRVKRDGLNSPWPQGGHWAIVVPERPNWMDPSDYTKAISNEFRTNDGNDNVHSGVDSRHSSGCVVLGNCPGSTKSETARYQISLEEDLRFKAAIACARRKNPNIILKTTSNAFPTLSQGAIIPRAVPVNPNCHNY
ncbi:MAG: RHS repeat-associated core domain-containing protein [Verrucomicrobiota bacterium]